MKRKGLALILVVGVLGVLAVLASAFAILSRLERKSASMRVQGTKAALLARSGMEDAVARLAVGQDATYGGEDWDHSGTLNGSEGDLAEEVFQQGTLNTRDCPVKQALRPSFFVRSAIDLDADGRPAPDRIRAEGRQRGYSGRTAVGSWVLRVEDQNARIHVNGGALDAEDRDPDGPGALPECGTLTSNLVPDHRDTSPEGPNGFLVRLLNNLDTVVTGTIPGTLGDEIVGGRSEGGYRSMEEIKNVLGAARYDPFKQHLTLDAWVDPKVVKPQPMDGRPNRWLDIDDAHRNGTGGAFTLTGLSVSAPTGSGIAGDPWKVGLVNSNNLEPAVSYWVSWERDYLYAWRQLRLAPLTPEPRAPVSINTSGPEVLASVLLGLKGTYVQVWDGNAGWDNGFGWNKRFGAVVKGQYTYPLQETEDTPWFRTRYDLGMTYGIVGRPWYGPAGYNPAYTNVNGCHGKPLIQSAPLGRLRETDALTPDQARAVAREIRNRIRDAGAFRTWADFNRFVDLLPLSEDTNADGVLDGPAYAVSSSNGAYDRHRYEREDANSNGAMNRQVFPPAPGSAKGTWGGVPVWDDVGAAAPGPGQSLGLTRPQKDVIRAMANPNTDLNDFNPDANLFKEVDKTDLVGIRSHPASYVHTTELALDLPGRAHVISLGRSSGSLPGQRIQAGILSFGLHRDTTQADFMRDYLGGAPISQPCPPPAAAPPYPVAGNQTTVSYPEPQTLAGGALAADASYDGQVGLGFVGRDESILQDVIDPGGTFTPSLGGDLFDSLNATGTGDAAQADVRGPFQLRLVRPAGQDVGSLFPDGAYGEKDATLKYLVSGNAWRYVAFWIKPNWFPEASPRVHALTSFSRGLQPTAVGSCPMGWGNNIGPADDVWMRPTGCYFLPARNNYVLPGGGTNVYVHDSAQAYGGGWPVHSLVYGQCHINYNSESLNVQGIPAAAPARPLGRLEGHRWQHVALFASGNMPDGLGLGWATVRVGIAPASGSPDPGSLHQGGGQITAITTHGDGTANHIRLGEIAAFNNLNCPADATFAILRAGGFSAIVDSGSDLPLTYFSGPSSQALLGRYYKEDGATYVSPKLPSGIRPLRLSWTEIPCDLWFDLTGPSGTPDDWADLQDKDRDGNGRPDVRIEIEAWDDRGTPSALDDVRLARCSDASASNLVPPAVGRLYYKAVFVNEWDPGIRLNSPLNVTPFLDDVTVLYSGPGGVGFLGWDAREPES